jgi:hypothetical protein
MSRDKDPFLRKAIGILRRFWRWLIPRHRREGGTRRTHCVVCDEPLGEFERDVCSKCST